MPDKPDSYDESLELDEQGEIIMGDMSDQELTRLANLLDPEDDDDGLDDDDSEDDDEFF